MFLIWIIIVMALLIFAAISEHKMAKQDEEWMKEAKEKDQWKKK